jgi:hypothetical protein
MTTVCVFYTFQKELHRHMYYSKINISMPYTFLGIAYLYFATQRNEFYNLYVNIKSCLGLCIFYHATQRNDFYNLYVNIKSCLGFHIFYHATQRNDFYEKYMYVKLNRTTELLTLTLLPRGTTSIIYM